MTTAKRELLQIEVDEVSLVDKPAVGVPFALIKNEAGVIPADEEASMDMELRKALTPVTDALRQENAALVADLATQVAALVAAGKVDADTLAKSDLLASKVWGLYCDAKTVEVLTKAYTEAKDTGDLPGIGAVLEKALAPAQELAAELAKAAELDPQQGGSTDPAANAGQVSKAEGAMAGEGDGTTVSTASMPPMHAALNKERLQLLAQLARLIADMFEGGSATVQDLDNKLGVLDNLWWKLRSDLRLAEKLAKAAEPGEGADKPAKVEALRKAAEELEELAKGMDGGTPSKHPKKLTKTRLAKLASATKALQELLAEGGMDELQAVADEEVAKDEAGGSGTDVAKALEEAQAKVGELTKANEELQAQLAKAAEERQAKEQELAKAATDQEAKVGELTKANEEGTAKIGELTKANEESNAKIAELTKRVQELEQSGVSTALGGGAPAPVSKGAGLFAGVIRLPGE